MADRLASVLQGQETPLDRMVHGTNDLMCPYRPLNKESLEIRLLTIYPATNSSELPVQCSLSHANLGKAPKPKYETISYTWGRSQERKTIVVDDLSLEVPVSAERAIRRMRHPDQSRVVWIDAICINQDDINEKNRQVEIMAEIYSNTSQGLIWLGEVDDSTGKALQSINAAYAEACAETNDFRDLFANILGTDHFREPLGFAPDFAALTRLFGRPWFGRRWVIQEALLAPSSRCIIGDFEMSWGNILRGTVYIACKSQSPSHPTSFSQAAHRVLEMWGLAEEKQAGRSISLNNIMSSSRGSQVQDERDVVYALLGLWLKLQEQTKPHHLLAPDYSKSPDGVVCDATRYIAAVDSNLFHLHHLHHRHKPDAMEKMLPSWAALWHRAPDSTCDSFHFLRHFSADGPDSRRHFRPPSEVSSRILSVRGSMVEAVRAVTDVINSNDTPSDVLARLGQFEMAWSSFTQQASALKSLRRLGEVLTAGGDHLRDPATEDFSVQGYTEWLKYLRCENSWPPDWRTVDEGEAAMQRKAAEYDRAFWYACRNRVLFTTASGRLGVGPQTLKEDDFVAVLYGCDYPATLRRCPNSHLHELIGIAYVEGIMFGEAVEEAGARGIEDVTFHLR
ncbi:hypothetical protein KC349_g6474 [Hortaea werneckii]|nr:hypothetical protein KC349_g6474 [Hortaea werneckii]